MPDELIESIKANAFWRVNFQPVELPERLSLAQCLELVERNRVQLRGWDYPHLQRNDEHGEMLPGDGYYESWTNWDRHVEFWRMFRSSQFLHYLACWEDLVSEEDRRDWRMPDAPVLGIVSTIYRVTEVFEFARRLTRAGLYSRGLIVDLSVNNTERRMLWVDDPRRMPFHEPRRTAATAIRFNKTISADDATSRSADLALDAAIEIFGTFGWTPRREQIEGDQARFLEGRAM